MRSVGVVAVLVLVVPVAHAAPEAPTSVPASAPSAARDTDAPVIEHEPISEARPGRAVTISAAIRDASGVAFPLLYFRVVGTNSWSRATMTRKDGKYHAVIPAFSATQNGVEYYIEAFDKQGNGPTYHGTRLRPHRIAVTQNKRAVAKSTPWYKRWWIWAIGGAVVAGSVAAIAIVASGDSGSGNPTGATLVVDAPAPTPTLPGL